MPSQISALSPSTGLSGTAVQFNKAVVPNHCAASNHDIEAAAASGMVPTPLTSNKSSRKPQTMVSSHPNSCATLDTSAGTLIPLSNSSCIPNRTQIDTNNDCCTEHSNGLVTPLVGVQEGNSHEPHQTKGEHSNDHGGSLTNQSNSSRLMCPELAISYTDTLVGKRAGYLATKQKVLEERVAALQSRVRTRQLQLVHSHASKQLNFFQNNPEEGSLSENGSASTLTGSECSMDASSPPSHHPGILPLPIQVDGASDDAFLPDEGSREMGGEEEVRGRGEDSFSSLESFVTSVTSEVSEGGEADTIGVQLEMLEKLMDGDVTDESSDEEGMESIMIHNRKHHLRSMWNKSRLDVGSRWVWLQRRIAELNKQIYRLDHHTREVQSKEKCVFLDGPGPLLPRYLSISNGSVLEQLRGNNGSGFISVGKTNNGNNGYSRNNSSGYAQYLPHLFLPESLLGAKLQVKDLLSPSPLGRNLLQLDETCCTAARVRPLLQRANRRVVRKRMSGRVRSCVHGDASFHPHLSMVQELPSRIALDTGIKQLLSEHSYAQLPTFNKRSRGGVSLLDRLSTPQPHIPEPSHSDTPSPVHTPQSFESIRGGFSSRKKFSLGHHQTSHDSTGGSPWSPGPSRPSTPSITPLQPPRKKRMTNSTPLFDIDNIVIPYSMASSTRLEKLEYKEIMTPNWREIEGQGLSVDNERSTMEEMNDQTFSTRHNRCELAEKKRFFNFVSGGGQRKRNRPHSMSLPSDSPRMASPPPPRRLTITSPSPTPLDHELAAHIHPIVSPWLPRAFPLSETEQKALLSPPPPPPPIITFPSQFSSSPRVLHTSTPSQTPPSRSSSALPTPLGSPINTPSDTNTPTTSPAEWVVNPLPPILPHLPCSPNHRAVTDLHRPLPPSPPLPHVPIILKLSKRI